MVKRILIGVALLATFLVVVLVDFFPLNCALFALVLYFSFRESLPLFGLKTEFWLTMLPLVFFAILPFWHVDAAALKVAFLMVLFVASGVAFSKFENPAILLPFLYPAVPVFLLFGICAEYGINYLCWLIVSVVASDSGAYFVGKFFGKRIFGDRKFSASSPNKTWEGTLGGVVVGTAAGFVFSNMMLGSLSVIMSAVASFVVVFFGVFGDLFESYLKRRVGVKDSSHLLGEHGGMLDRCDGYLFGAVAFWVIF